jgi:hypothetical protein
MAAVTAWIESVLGPARVVDEDNPGRVTIRRLNRAEYNNTVRDLLNIATRPADEFPLDDSGYGFDNIGDVLSLSPLLMEKYMGAARTLSRIAVYGSPYSPKPILLARLMPKKFQDDAPPRVGNTLPFSLRGSLYGTYLFPVDGEYEFHVRLANYRGQDVNDLTPEQRQVLEERRKRFLELERSGPKAPVARRAPGAEQRKSQEEAARSAFPPVKMVLSLDGATILTDVVEGSVDFQYARGASVVRVPVTAGEHMLRASFPELADMADPQKNVNPDGRRKLYVDYMDILGPFNPSSDPPTSYRRVFVCGHAPGRHEAGCARQILSNLARRAYRRLATTREVDTLVRLTAMATRNGDSFEEGIRLALQSVLISPNFLFRVERDPESGSGAAHTVDEFELASRLSYFLWSRMPDEDLFRAGAEHTLRQPGVLEAQVRRMLRDAKSVALIENFAGQWLNLRLLDRKKPEPSRFPAVDDELLDGMRRETELFFTEVVREDRSILDLVDGHYIYANGPLARYYGINGVNGEEFQRVEVDGSQRSGLLTQASILTISSYANRTSPVLRGKWVLETLLGAGPPPPPPDVPKLDEASLGSSGSMRERLEQHRANAACAVCHNQMDPIGFGLENYDAAGAWRTHDGRFPIDPSGVLPDGRTFNGAKDLKRILKAHSFEFTRNLTEKMLTYALGRGLEAYDRMAVERIAQNVVAADYRFSALVMGIVNSKPFQMRNGTGKTNVSE